MSYSHPAAEYVRQLKQQQRRRLWTERAISAVLFVALVAPMFADWLQ